MEQLHRSALQNGIPTLYHYEKFDPDYLATTLHKNIIHCSHPKNLNDPWDCKPVFDPHALDDPEVLEREIAWRQEHAAKGLWADWADEMRSDPEFRVSFMIGASPPIEAMIARRRIYCLTPKPDSTLNVVTSRRKPSRHLSGIQREKRSIPARLRGHLSGRVSSVGTMRHL